MGASALKVQQLTAYDDNPEIAAFLAEQENKSLLRFLTCGSVDDGKSTLIGRLLYDTKLIFEDQLATLERDSKKHGTDGDNIDFALLVDGLEAERLPAAGIEHADADQAEVRAQRVPSRLDALDAHIEAGSGAARPIPPRCARCAH